MNTFDLPLRYEHPVLLVGPADIDIGLYQKLSHDGYRTIAADGGANRLFDLQITPDAIIGDLDSLKNREKYTSGTKIIQVEEQETTDFEKCLNYLDAPAYIAMGFTGKRLDHTLSNIHTMLKFHNSKKVLLVGSDDLTFIYSGKFKSDDCGQVAVSIYPLSPIRFSHSEGLAYPLRNLEMKMGAFVGTSNNTTDDNFSILPAIEHAQTPYLITLSNDFLYGLIKSSLRKVAVTHI